MYHNELYIVDIFLEASGSIPFCQAPFEFRLDSNAPLPNRNTSDVCLLPYTILCQTNSIIVDHNELKEISGQPTATYGFGSLETTGQATAAHSKLYNSHFDTEELGFFQVLYSSS